MREGARARRLDDGGGLRIPGGVGGGAVCSCLGFYAAAGGLARKDVARFRNPEFLARFLIYV